MSGMAEDELKTRMGGMSDEEREVVLGTFSTKEILTELIARVVIMEKTIDNVQRAFGE